MKTSVTEKGQWERELAVEVPAERIQREMKSALRRYQKRLEIPGFRKGKVPLRIIEQRYGPSIRSGLIEDLLPKLLREASEESGLVPAATPRITAVDDVADGGLTFVASIDIWPEVDVQGEAGLKLERLRHEVTDEDVEEQLQELRAQHASERTVERPLARGDVLIADLQRLDEAGLPIVGERYEERYFHIGGEKAPSPEFEEALIGIEAGEDRKVRFTYRSDLPDETLAGRPEHFEVHAREVRERILPELDDEFAKDVGDPFDTLQALKDHLHVQIEARWARLAQQKLRSDAMEGLLAANPVDLPPSLVRTYVEAIRHEQQRGHHDHDHDHDHEISDEERRLAEGRLKAVLLLEGLRKKLDVEVSDEEFDAYLEERAQLMGLETADLKRSPRAADLRRDLEEDKIFEVLEAQAHIEERTV